MTTELPADAKPTMARQIADAARTFQSQRTGLSPGAVSVVLSDQTLVITMHGALSIAELAAARTPAGASRIQEFHRELFAASAEPLRQEIKRITGVEVSEAASDVEPGTGAVVQVFTSGTMVQVFLLGRSLPAQTWSDSLAGN